jgi:hypothetical protein
MAEQSEARERAGRIRRLYDGWMRNELRGRQLVREGRERIDFFVEKTQQRVHDFMRDSARLLQDLRGRLGI